MKSSILTNCPRCGGHSLELFSSHGYCAQCNYGAVPEQEEAQSIPRWAIDFLRTIELTPAKEKLATAI